MSADKYPSLLYGKVNMVNLRVFIGSLLARISPYRPFPWKRSLAVNFFVKPAINYLLK